MNREVIYPAQLPRPVGPYSPASRSGDLVFTSGQLPLDPQSGKLVSDDFEHQLRQVLENLKLLLNAAGTDLTQILKCTIFLTDLGNFPIVNRVFGEYFPDEPPARSTVQVSRLPLDALVEIEAIAVVKNEN